MEDITFELVTSTNLLPAVAVVCMAFPGQMKEIVQSLDSSTRPREQWRLAGAREHIGRIWKYYIVIVDNEPVGVIGIYTLENAPLEGWVGWTCVIPPYRERGVGKKAVEFILKKAEEQGCTTLRAWQTASHRFDPMCKLFQDMGFKMEVFPGQDNTDGYRVFSRSLDGQPTTPCPPDTVMVGGCDHQLQETQRSIELERIEKRISQKKREARQNRQLIERTYGSVSNYLNNGPVSLIELTSSIERGERNNVIESALALNDNSFGIEEEKETFEGFSDYVKPDDKNKYNHNERRIWAIIDEKGEVMGLVVCHNYIFPKKYRKRHRIHGNFSITYLMVKIEFRKLGIGRMLREHAREKCVEFIKEKIGEENPQIIEMIEQNDPMNAKLNDAVQDLGVSCLGLTERQFLWAKLGYQEIDGFNYKQVSLREGLEGISLGLYVILPQGHETISSELLLLCVKCYADLALSKQARNINEDPDMQKMERQLTSSGCPADLKLKGLITEFIEQDTEIMAALKQESVGALGDPFSEEEWEEKTIGELLKKYRDKVDEYRVPDSI